MQMSCCLFGADAQDNRYDNQLNYNAYLQADMIATNGSCILKLKVTK